MSAGGVQPSNPDPLRETTRYVKVADLSHGSFGFVQLARNTETQELVAIKFIERGDRVNRCVLLHGAVRGSVVLAMMRQLPAMLQLLMADSLPAAKPGPLFSKLCTVLTARYISSAARAAAVKQQPPQEVSAQAAANSTECAQAAQPAG